MAERNTYSVTEYISELNVALANVTGDVIGEVSEVKQAASGHVYFTIKDKESTDVLPCTIWRAKYALSSVEIEVGMELLVRGKPNYYGPFGKLSFIADSVSLVGEGALLKAYEKLKKKLEAEGIFDESKKRPIPTYPHTIGVVTSLHGAVIHDFNNNLKKYGFKVLMLDTRVEGPESGKDIVLSVRAFRKKDIDVLVVLRGGGSIQSLAGFDNEALVREIATFPKPVIAGLGHHQDVPLAALAADSMESTPSLVAELLNESWNTAQYSLERSEQKIVRKYESVLADVTYTLDSTFLTIEKGLTTIFEVYQHAERAIKEGVIKLGYSLGRSQKEIRTNANQLISLLNAQIKNYADRIQQADRLIESNNPERQLKLGYSLAFAKGKIVRSTKDLTKGSLLTVRFADGSAETIINELS